MREKERVRFYQERLDALREYSAVFAVSDYYAVDLMRFLQKNGVCVPEDVSVAGFDDGEICRLVSPALTSVRQDAAGRAEAAIRLLGRMRREPGFSGDFLSKVGLVARESTAGLRH